MIPKVAHFYWYGERGLPRLRQEGIDSFKRLNPDWQVFLHRSGEDPNASFRTRVTTSDAVRYAILHRAGGVYFDTDIIFVKPMPELTKDLWMACDAAGYLYGVHALGACEGSPLFKWAMDQVILRRSAPQILSMQSLGTHLWQSNNVLTLADRMGLAVQRIPVEAFLSISPVDIEYMWSGSDAIHPRAIGIHWYGGDRLSEEFEDCGFDQLPECPVKAALGMCRV